MPSNLERMLRYHRVDFQCVRSKPFAHFYCPILGIDEPAELCKGHVINKSIRNSCRATVVQRSDIDSFYGRVAEAELSTLVEHLNVRVDEALADRDLSRVFRPRLEKDGEVVEHYAPSGPVPNVHSQVKFQGSDGTCFDLCVKIAPHELHGLGPDRLQMVLEADFRSQVIASVIKAAHLSLFHMLGYHYVFSPSGQWTANLLAEYFRTCQQLKEAELRQSLHKYFAKYETMVAPIGGEPEQLRGTVEDKQVLVLQGGSRRFYAVGVIVRLGRERFCVFLPIDDGSALETYFGFLKEPPLSVAARLFQFVAGKGTETAHWDTPPGEPFRIYRKPEMFPRYC